MKAFFTLLKTEGLQVMRSIDTILFGIGFPAIVAVFMGILVKDKTVFPQTFSAVSTIGICATGLMGIPLTISDYRHRKILKRYSVTPLSPLLILLVQFIINLVIALLSLCVVYFIMMGFGFRFTGTYLYFGLAFLLITFAMYGLGMMVASIAPNIKSANLICTLLYFPMIFLSGTVVPYQVMPGFLQTLMDFSPLTQGIGLLNHYALNLDTGMVLPILYLAAVGIICSGISVRCFKWI